MPFRQRLQQMRAALRRRSSLAVAAIEKHVGPDELGIATALVVLTIGLWPRLGRDTLIADGAILLWMFLPTRSPFIVGRPVMKDERKND